MPAPHADARSDELVDADGRSLEEQIGGIEIRNLDAILRAERQPPWDMRVETGASLRLNATTGAREVPALAMEPAIIRARCTVWC